MSNKTKDMHDSNADGAGDRPVIKISCDEIQPLLTGYMSRELGESQSALIREHIRLCTGCHAAAKEIQEMMDLLKHSGLSNDEMPGRLSDERRARIRRAYQHPIISWIEMHHVLVSIFVATTLVILVLAALIMMTVVYDDQTTDDSVPITWIVRQSPQLDEIPEGEVPLIKPVGPDNELMPSDPLVIIDRGMRPETPLKEPESPEPESPSLDRADVRKIEEERAERQADTARRRKNRAVGIGILLLAIAGAAYAAIKSRARQRRQDTEEDGTVDEGPAPMT